jgi:hypothetical protein
MLAPRFDQDCGITLEVFANTHKKSGAAFAAKGLPAKKKFLTELLGTLGTFHQSYGLKVFVSYEALAAVTRLAADGRCWPKAPELQ